jgi:four helix bundle protein
MSEEFCLKSNVRRAAVLIPSNIAEGQAPNHAREFPQFLSIAPGSLAGRSEECSTGFRVPSSTSGN